MKSQIQPVGSQKQNLKPTANINGSYNQASSLNQKYLNSRQQFLTSPDSSYQSQKPPIQNQDLVINSKVQASMKSGNLNSMRYNHNAQLLNSSISQSNSRKELLTSSFNQNQSQKQLTQQQRHINLIEENNLNRKLPKQSYGSALANHGTQQYQNTNHSSIQLQNQQSLASQKQLSVRPFDIQVTEDYQLQNNNHAKGILEQANISHIPNIQPQSTTSTQFNLSGTMQIGGQQQNQQQQLLLLTVTELKSQFKELKTHMNHEIEVLKQKVSILETNNKSLKDIQEKIIKDQNRIIQPGSIDYQNIYQENIDDEYKSKKREINELSINLDVPPTVKLSLKSLGQQLEHQSASQKQLLKELKKESFVEIHKISLESKSGMADKKRDSMTTKQKSKDTFLDGKRPSTTMRDLNTKSNNKYIPSLISPQNKRQNYDETELESTIQVAMTNKANTPIESPYRNRKNKIMSNLLQKQQTKQHQNKSQIKKQSSRIQHNNYSDQNLSDKIQSNVVFNQMQKQSLASFKANQYNDNEKQQVTPQQQRNTTQISQNRDFQSKNAFSSNLINQSIEDDPKKTKLMDQSALVESPKFLNFINTNTARKQEEDQNHERQSIRSSRDMQTNKNIGSINNLIQPRQLIDSQKDIFEDLESLTERGQKPEINEKVVLSSRRKEEVKSSFKQHNNIKEGVNMKLYNQQVNRTPLIRSYMHYRPQNFKLNDSNELEDDSMNSDDCDEKRSYTPEPRHLDKLNNKSAQNLNHSLIGIKGSLSTSMSGIIQGVPAVGGVNSVYKSSKMELSKYISKHKSNIDYQNKYNVMEIGGYKALIENKGSKCQCNIKNIKDMGSQYDFKVCGEFCKLLGSKEQKRIILEQIFNELDKPPTEKKIKRYLIDAKWIRKWCDFTNFDTTILSNQLQPQIKSQIEDLLDDLNQSSQLNTDRNVRFDSSTLYQKPTKIENNQLLDAEHKGNIKRLRENLIENFDFIVVSPLIWLHLYSWYSADSQIARYMQRDKFNTNQYILELYPHLKQKNLNLSYMGPQLDNSSESDDEEYNDNQIISKNIDDQYSPQLRQRVVTQTVIQNKDQLTIGNRLFHQQYLRKQNKLSNKSQEFIRINEQ